MNFCSQKGTLTSPSKTLRRLLPLNLQCLIHMTSNRRRDLWSCASLQRCCRRFPAISILAAAALKLDEDLESSSTALEYIDKVSYASTAVALRKCDNTKFHEHATYGSVINALLGSGPPGWRIKQKLTPDQ